MKTTIKYNSFKHSFIIIYHDENEVFTIKRITKETAKLMIIAFKLTYCYKLDFTNKMVRKWVNY